MKAVIVIPARLDATRLHGKLLLPIGGKPIIQHTYENAINARQAEQVVIATDSDEIAAVAAGFGCLAIKTASTHTTGTARIAEAIASLDADIIVNVQGDEPELSPAHIDALIQAQLSAGTFASTLACLYPSDLDASDPNCVKVVIGRPLGKTSDQTQERTADRTTGLYEAVYFSRSLVPSGADAARYLHIGAYAFKREALLRFSRFQQSKLERDENLEQLRILDMGERLSVTIVDKASPGIDTEADYKAARERFARSS